MPIVQIERAIFQLPLPTLINVLYALFFPCAIAGGLVAWPHIADNFWAGVVFDHVLAFLVVQAAVMPFLAANFQKPAGSISARAARMTSSFGLLVCIVALTAQLLGRTILVCVVVGFLLVQIQLSSWGESLVLPLQTEGALGCLIPAYLQDLLNSTPLELIIQFRGSGAPRLLRRFLYAVRTVAPLVLLPDEETDDAIALLRPKLAGRLDTPVVEQLPSAARAVLEWAQSESLRLRSGSPHGPPRAWPARRRHDWFRGEDKADSAMASEGCERRRAGAADVASGLAGDAAAPTLAALGEWRGEETDDPDAGEGDEDAFTPPPGAPPRLARPARRRPGGARRASQTSSSPHPGRVRGPSGPSCYSRGSPFKASHNSPMVNRRRARCRHLVGVLALHARPRGRAVRPTPCPLRRRPCRWNGSPRRQERSGRRRREMAEDIETCGEHRERRGRAGGEASKEGVGRGERSGAGGERPSQPYRV